MLKAFGRSAWFDLGSDFFPPQLCKSSRRFAFRRNSPANLMYATPDGFPACSNTHRSSDNSRRLAGANEVKGKNGLLGRWNECTLVGRDGSMDTFDYCTLVPSPSPALRPFTPTRFLCLICPLGTLSTHGRRPRTSDLGFIREQRVDGSLFNVPSPLPAVHAAWQSDAYLTCQGMIPPLTLCTLSPLSFLVHFLSSHALSQQITGSLTCMILRHALSDSRSFRETPSFCNGYGFTRAKVQQTDFISTVNCKRTHFFISMLRRSV